MAVPESTFQFIGLLAASASAGTFFRFDMPTRTILALFASLMWVVFGFSAYQIEVVESTVKTYEVLPLAYVGYGAGVVMALIFLNNVFGLLKDTSRPIDGPEDLRQ